jgi:hopanoid C-3 methylase
MKLLAVHPGPLMYTKVFLRLEPLGLELAAEAARRAGHEVRLIDLQAESHRDFERWLRDWEPEAIAFSCNYLANVPEIIDLAKLAKQRLPGCLICVGGHSASFTANALLGHGEGAIDCVLKGEGEIVLPAALAAARDGVSALSTVPGVVTVAGEGPPPQLIAELDDVRPARDLLQHRRKYFIGTLDPCASVEFSRGCPWDCTFCSAWTFYGRSYRVHSPEWVVDDLARVHEPGIFIVDDVAFIQERHGLAIGEALARKGIRKKFYLETRGDVLLRNQDVFKFWSKMGLHYMFLGLEAIDEEGLRKYRKRVSLSRNFEALEFARSLGINVSINIIADPDWDRERFAVVRQWCLEVPEIVNLSVNTPYPGTETWHTEQRRLQTRDYRLFDIQHCVLPTRLPLQEFYAEIVATQRILARKHFSWRAARTIARTSGRLLMRGQTNFVRSLFKFNSVFNSKLMVADHERPVHYEIPLPPPAKPIAGKKPSGLYIHTPRGRASRAIDDKVERFVDETRMGAK